jgi:hypothetical protein
VYKNYLSDETALDSGWILSNTDKMPQRGRAFLLALTVLPWLGNPSSATEPSEDTASHTTALGQKVAPTVEACQGSAERQGREGRGWDSVEWMETAPDSTSSRTTTSATRLALSGLAHASTGWVPFRANCDIGKRGTAAVSVRPMPAAAATARSQTLDLSSIARNSVPLNLDAVPLMSLPPPPAEPGQQEASGSTEVRGTFSEITPDIPTAPLKKQDFFHDHRLGIKIETPF